MVRRTTIELDEELVARAKRALGQTTTRATVEEALRRATLAAEGEHQERAERQQRFFARFSSQVDLEVLRSEEMWR